MARVLLDVELGSNPACDGVAKALICSVIVSSTADLEKRRKSASWSVMAGLLVAYGPGNETYHGEPQKKSKIEVIDLVDLGDDSWCSADGTV